MEKVLVVYASNSGNTEAMAKFVVEGIEAAGKEAELIEASNANAEDLLKETAFALGSFASGTEQIDEENMEPLVEALDGKLEGKTVLLFGSHDWGDGEFIRTWAEQMQGFGAKILGGEGITCVLEPDDETADKLRDAGKELASI